MTAVDILISALSETDHRTQLRRALIASTVGTTIEWYDFLLYGPFLRVRPRAPAKKGAKSA